MYLATAENQGKGKNQSRNEEEVRFGHSLVRAVVRFCSILDEPVRFPSLEVAEFLGLDFDSLLVHRLVGRAGNRGDLYMLVLG